ncbi:MAG: hypothetical protein RIC56_01085 [Pseudomonadales bacterium]
MAAAHVSATRWAGKALGSAAALIFAPADPAAVAWWLTAGFALGHLVDSLVFATPEDPTTVPADDREDHVLAPATMRFAFAALGRIAAASGSSGPEHVRCATRLMARLAFDDARRQEALVWYHAGHDRAFPFDTVSQPCRADLAAHPVLRDLSIDALCRMAALADTPAATETLLNLGEAAGIGRDVLATQAVAAAALLPMRSDIERACDALGVTPGDSADTVRLAYRRRVSRWHPDRLGADAGAEERALAERRMCELRDALDTLLAAAPR